MWKLILLQSKMILSILLCDSSSPKLGLQTEDYKKYSHEYLRKIRAISVNWMTNDRCRVNHKTLEVALHKKNIKENWVNN